MARSLSAGDLLFLFAVSALLCVSVGFQSDELLLDDEEFGLEGGVPTKSPDLTFTRSSSPPAQPQPTTTTSRRRFSDQDTDSKIQFELHHAFGDSDFSPAGTFSARLKTWSHGGQTLTKLRFSRNAFTEEEKEKFSLLLKGDDFYSIRLPSSVANPPGRDYVISSVKARCLLREGLDEHFVIHTDGVNILAVNYGSPGACPYPRQLRLPSKWSFNSNTVLKNSEQAPRAPVFSEEVFGGEGVEGEVVPPQERSFWAKYWMYLIPLGLIVMNAVTQAMNMAEEQVGAPSAAGQAQQPAAIQRGSSSSVRRR